MNVIKRNLLTCAILTGSLLLNACALPGTPARTPTPSATEAQTAEPTVEANTRPNINAPQVVDANSPVVVDGLTIPAQSVILTFEQPNGTIAEVMVSEGDKVDAGTPLVRLDTRALELRVEDAEAELAEAKAGYEKLIEGASPEQIDEMRALIDRAQAEVRRARSIVTPQDIASARADLAATKAELAYLRSLPDAESVRAAEAKLAQVRQRFKARMDAFSAEKNRLELRVEQIANNLRDLQDLYSRIYWNNRNKEGDQGDLSPEDVDAEAAALRDVQNGEKALEQARLDLEEARLAEIHGRDIGESEVSEAEAGLERAHKGATPDDIAQAQARIVAAERNLSKLQGEQRDAEIQFAEAQLQATQARLADLTADPTTSELALAEARLKRVEVTLKQARLALDRAVLRAPFSGTVVSISFVPGVAISGTSNVTLADLTTWQIETEDISELNVARIREGDPVNITVYAIPGLQLRGTVRHIKALGQSDIRAGTTYTAIITVDDFDERLRWNMTTSVQIRPRTS